ncbi:MAG: DUF551 domain-containing protein [Deinococcus sp.]|nr:DUF551 domain-containing protein [Deinococcus sp.]
MTTPEQPSPSVSRAALSIVLALFPDPIRSDRLGDYRPEIAQAVSALRAALTQPEAPAPAPPAERWLPVSERLPEEGQRVLFADIGAGIHAGRRCSDGWDEPVDFWDEGEITHWMPLPEPPTRLRALAGAEVKS